MKFFDKLNMNEQVKNDWWKYMLGIIGAILVYQLNTFNGNIVKLSEDLQQVIVLSTQNQTNIAAHEISSREWKDRISTNETDIKALKNGEVDATKDRITREEVDKKFELNNVWVGRNFQRKN